MKMNEAELFLRKVREEYIKARNAITQTDKIKRGTSHTISSIAEDLFAEFISKSISDNYEIWIDPQITIDELKNKSGNRVFLFRPDICIIHKKTNLVEMIFDLKMDLGYKRNEFIQQVEERISELNKIVNHTARCSLKENTTLSFSKKLKWFYIILSQGNISENKFNEVLNFFKTSTKSELFVLSGGKHLNSHDQDFKIVTNMDDFNRLNKKLISLK